MGERGGTLEGMDCMRDILNFYQGKKVFVTGHTGFKGTWLCKMLIDAGADVTGYALPAPTEPSLFAISGIEGKMGSIIGDIRDREKLESVFEKAEPEIVLHLAAQPIVRMSYQEPAYTYETNVMGTVNICECIRKSKSVKSFLNVTTDKVYLNREWEWGYRETDMLDGYDPYSNSKSCSELVTHSYNNSFLREMGIAASTARAGNVIGGGDFAQDRIIPDCVRAVLEGKEIVVRNPYSTRPYQHVLEPLLAYLMIAKRQYEDISYADSYNVGPNDCDCVTTGELVTLFCKQWGEGQTWVNQSQDGPHEANFLQLDCAKLKKQFGWQPKWHIEDAIAKTCEFTKVYRNAGNIAREMEREIEEYIER